MSAISINSIKAGMVLASDARDRNGRLLIRTGTSLTDESVRILKIWGVLEVDVEGVSRENLEDEALNVVDPAILAQASAEVAERFCFNDPDNPAVVELKRLCTQRNVEDLLSGMSVVQAAEEPLPADVSTDSPDASFPLAQPGARLTRVEPAQLVLEDIKLGSLPIICNKLLDVLNDPRSSATDVAEVISNDTDLSARLLRIVNSAFYGMRSKIDTVTRAVAILGGNQLLSLAMGMSVVNFFKDVPGDLVDMQSFWRHSVACGVASRLLASHRKTPNTERFFVAGLLHDIGRLVLFRELPEHAGQALALAASERIPLFEAEKKVLGFGHEKLGGVLLRSWKFPVSLEKNVYFHHAPHKAANRPEASIIHLADMMVNALELGSSGERLVPPLSAQAWEALELPPGVIAQIALQVNCQVEEILQFFLQDE